MHVQFQEFSVSQALQPFVHSYWSGEFNLQQLSAFGQSVVPNGYVEMIIHLTTDHCSISRQRDQWTASPEYTLIGLHTESYEVRFPNLVKVFGIRFHPEGLANIFGVPASLFSEHFEDSTNVFGNPFRDFCQRIREMQSMRTRITLTDSYLQDMLRKHQKSFDYSSLAARTIRDHQGLLNQQELMEKVPISPRQLQRDFRNQYGITPKAYMRIARLNAVQKYMQTKKAVDFGDLTFVHGFADQSHFIREFKSFTGAAPRSFVKDRSRYIVNI